MKPEKDNTFCYYPFYQIALKTWDHRGIRSAAPCCNSIRPSTPDPLNLASSSSLGKMTHNDIFHSDAMKKIREDMLNGVRNPACQTCWEIEDRGSQSYRLHSNFDSDSKPVTSNSGGIPKDRLENPELSGIDFLFGDNCNLRCRSCQPGLSNKLRIDYRYFWENQMDTKGINGFEYDVAMDDRVRWLSKGSEHKSLYWPEKSDQWDNILENIKQLKKIRASGGETTLTKPFTELIDRAIEADHAKDMTLDFHTNATKFNEELVGKLFKFKALNMHWSIDSYGKNYEYVRFPMTWPALEKSIFTFLDRTEDCQTHIEIQVTNVLSALNAFNIVDLVDYWVELRKKYPKVIWDFWVDYMWPDNKYTNVKFLPKELKLELIELYRKKFTETNNLYAIQHIIDFLQAKVDYTTVTENDRKNMLREITLFDQSRGQSYKDYLDQRIINYLENPIEDSDD